MTFKVTLVDNSQGQDRDDCAFDVWVKADDADEAAEKALIDERANVYVSAVRPATPTQESQS